MMDPLEKNGGNVGAADVRSTVCGMLPVCGIGNLSSVSQVWNHTRPEFHSGNW